MQTQTILLLTLMMLVMGFYERMRRKKTSRRQAEQNEHQCLIVSSRGLMKQCHLFPQEPVSSIKSLYLTRDQLSNVRRHDRVYVPTSALPHLVSLLDSIAQPIVLVTGDADETVQDAAMERQIADHPKIAVWFAQNLALDHAKCKFLPIGLDYHSLTREAKWNMPIMSSKEQENVLLAVKSKSLPIGDRKLKVFGNFHLNYSFSLYKQDRIDALNQIPKHLIDYVRKPTSRTDTWTKQAQYAFVASPHGNGLDCHRTWEALCLGCIPIVKTSPLDPMFAGLPVWIVKEWSEVNESSMRAKVDAYTLNPKMLTLDHWSKKMTVQ